MRIAYLGQMADVGTENGISKKIRAQTRRWLSAGHEVRYFSLAKSDLIWPGLAPLEVDVQARGSFGTRILRSLQVAQRIRAWRPDVIYFRYAYHSAGLPALFREFPTVAEINSDDLTEYPLTLSRAKWTYHRLTRRRVLAAVTAFVPVTRELRARFAAFGKPAEVIANGIELEPVSTAAIRREASATRLVFVGSDGTPWHGLERVAELSRMFPQVGIDVVGCSAPAAVPASPAIRFHGPLPRDDYAPMFQSATAAIGTMALFKKRMDEACPLKVREYLAGGLPVIAAYRDTDIPDDTDYFLRLPNDAMPLEPHRERIAAWLAHWQTRRVPRAAIAHLDNAVKEERRLAFLQRIIKRR